MREVSHVTPIKKLSSKTPSINHLRIFGCVSWEHILDYFRNMLHAKSHACIMIGCSKVSRDY